MFIRDLINTVRYNDITSRISFEPLPMGYEALLFSDNGLQLPRLISDGNKFDISRHQDIFFALVIMWRRYGFLRYDVRFGFDSWHLHCTLHTRVNFVSTITQSKRSSPMIPTNVNISNLLCCLLLYSSS